MRYTILALLLLAPAALARDVTVSAVEKTYPIAAPGKRKGFPPVEKFQGKDTVTTTAVVLENRYLRVAVLPELGGRLVEAVYKPTGEDLFWRHDEIRDGVSWSMGGGRWSFPFWEHGRHFDETGGYVVTRAGDGSATVAVDMRFDAFLLPRETGRYGRATNLRLAQMLTLRPDEAAFTWTGRVTNPLPIRHGFKLWYLLRQPAVEGTRVCLPAAAVTGHGAHQLDPWDVDTVVRDLQTSVFAIGMRHGFAGWFFPGRNLNVLRVQAPDLVPGAKQVLYRPSRRGYIEMWGGTHEVFEECGRFLPAFGAYEATIHVLAAVGIGEADFANEHAAVRCRREGDAWHVAVAPTGPHETLEVALAPAGRRDDPVLVARGPASPEQPLAGTARDLHEGPVVLAVRSEAKELVRQTFPIDRGPMPEKEFAAVQARTNGTLRGGKGLYAEATDLVAEHQLSLPRTAGMHEAILAESDDPRALLDAARRLMRVREDDEAVRAGLEKVLAARPDHPHAHLYLAMWLLEADRPEEADAHLAKARALPGGRYLAALRAVARGRAAEALELARSGLEAEPADTFYADEDSSLALRQPGSTVANTRPLLLVAVLHETLGQASEARAVAEGLLRDDPALIEAWMILGDEARLRTLTEANPSGRRAAEATLAALRAGRWPGIGRP